MKTMAFASPSWTTSVALRSGATDEQTLLSEHRGSCRRQGMQRLRDVADGAQAFFAARVISCLALLLVLIELASRAL
jgi:hypothetical protein